MDYNNPETLLQSTLAPMPQSDQMPGAGYGALEGALRAQAANRANQMFDLNMAGQAQSLAMEQAKAREWNQFQPYRKTLAEGQGQEAKAKAMLTGAQASMTTEQYNQLKSSGALDQYGLAATYADPIANAVKSGNQLQAQAILEDYKNKFKNVFPGKEIDPAFNTIGPDTVTHFQNAKGISAYAERSQASKAALQSQELGVRQTMQEKELATQKEIAAARVETEKAIAKLHSDTSIQIAKIGAEKTPEWLKQQVVDAQANLQEVGDFKKLSARDRALILEGPNIMQDIYTKAFTGAQGKAFGAQEIIRGLTNPNQPIMQQPGLQPQGAPQGQPQQSVGAQGPGAGTFQNPHQPQSEQDFNQLKPGEYYMWQGRKYQRANQ